MKININNTFRLLLTLFAALAMVGCQKGYEMSLPLALSRNDFQFAKGSGKTYFMVYSTSNWTIKSQDDDSWIHLSTYSGSGEAQVNVTYDANKSLSRGVTFEVSTGELTKTIYFSQEAGFTEDTFYALEVSNINLLAQAISVELEAETSMPEENVLRGYETIHYLTESTDWVKNVTISDKVVSFEVTENTTGVSRTAQIEITFPVASWDTPIKCVLTITQDVESVGFGSVVSEVVADPNGSEMVVIDMNVNYSSKIYPNYDILFSFKDAEGNNLSWLRNGTVNSKTMQFTAMPNVNSKVYREGTLAFELVDKTSGAKLDNVSVLVKQDVGNLSDVGSGSDSGETPKDDQQDF